MIDSSPLTPRRGSGLCTLGLLAFLSAPGAAANADEIRGPELFPPANAQEVEAQHLDAAERIALINKIEASVRKPGDDRAAWAEEIKIDLTAYKNSLPEAKDFTLDELGKASSLAISVVNMLGFRDDLPKELQETYIAAEVITLHDALLVKIQSMPKDDSNRASYEQRAASLLGDIMWSQAYESAYINEAAAKLFAARIFDCDECHYEARIAIFRYRVENNSKFNRSEDLLNRVMDFAKTRFKDCIPPGSELSELRELAAAFGFTDKQVEALAALTREQFKGGGSSPLLVEFCGPLWGVVLAGNPSVEDGKEERILATVEFLNSIVNPLQRRQALKIPPQLGNSAEFYATILEHAVTGNRAVALGAAEKVETWADVEARQELRLFATSFLLGTLSGLDNAFSRGHGEAVEIVMVAVPRRGIVPYPKTVKIPWSPQYTEGVAAVAEARESIRDMLGAATADAWTDDRRAALLVALIAADYSRFPSIEHTSAYAAGRLEQLAKHFPDAIAGSQEGRYASKVGGVRYFPAIQVEGEPSAYADYFFYMRDAMASHRYGKSWAELKTPDKELHELALRTAEAHQNIFICEVIERLWADDPANRPVESHRMLGPSAMARETFRILDGFPCFSRNTMLRLRLGNKEGIEFLREAEAVKAEARQVTLINEPIMAKILEQ